MARFSRLRTLTTIVEGGLIPILYHGDPDLVMRAVDGCVSGGSRVFEFTNRGDGALRTFESVLERCRERHPDLVVGVGSIGDPHTAAAFLSAGADFVVSPLWNEELARLCNSFKVAHVPGCGSVTEIAAAESAGCELVKLFPAGGLGGPGFIRAVRGPRPWTSIVPTGGVAPEEENVKEWIRAGAACLGIGSKLCDPKALQHGDDPALARRVADVLRWIREARGEGWSL